MTCISYSQSNTTKKADNIFVRDAMTQDVITISPEDTIENAARVMTNFGISSLVVLSQKKIIGILTERDILTRVVASGRNPKKVLVKTIMTNFIITAKPNVSIETAGKIMIENKIKKLPIVSEEDDLKIVGILSLTDLAGLKPDVWKEKKPKAKKKPLDIKALVKRNESQHLEFKSSFRYCHIRKEIDPELEFNCLKTICAFLNASGGDLIIGISDRNGVVGIEADYKSIKNLNRDGFQNYLINQIASKIGNIYLNHIEIFFHKVQRKEICRVHVEASNWPAFLKYKGKQLFFVRTGNGSRSFNISEAAKYLNQRWN
jgi:CBS domain-containing protein